MLDEEDTPEWQLSVTSGADKGYEAPGPLSLILYGDNGMSELFKVGEEEEEDICFKTGETKEFTPEVDTSILVQL